MSVSINNSLPTNAYLIAQIYWLNKIRKNTKEPEITTGINLSITILLCTYIESVLNELINSILVNRLKSTKDESCKRILIDFQNKLKKASWNQYIEICKVLLPKPLNNYTNNEIWKGVKTLFLLRNSIVHGKRIESELHFNDDFKEIEYKGVYEKILDYFIEQNVVKPNQLKTSTHKILSNQTTIHFIKITEKFINEIFPKICDNQNLDIWGTFNAYKYNTIYSFGIEDSEIEKNTNKIDKGDLPF